MRIGVLAPMPSELRPIVKRLGLRPLTGAGDKAAGRRVHGGRYGAVDVVAVTTGIGPEAAAEATERLLEAARVDHVVVVGVAGAIVETLAIGDLIAVETVIDGRDGSEHRPHRLGAAAGTGAPSGDGEPGEGESSDGTPGDRESGDSQTGDGTVGDRRPAGGLHTFGDLITDRGRIAELRDQGVVAMDMETAAVAAVCERRRCPWSVIRAVSDRVDDGIVNDAIAGLAGPDGAPRFAAVLGFVMRNPRRARDLMRLGRDLAAATKAAAAETARLLAALGETAPA